MNQLSSKYASRVKGKQAKLFMPSWQKVVQGKGGGGHTPFQFAPKVFECIRLNDNCFP